MRRNLAPVVGLVLCVTAVVGYFSLVMRQAPWLTHLLEVPYINLGLLAAGVVLALMGVRRAWRRPPLYRGRFLAPVLALPSLAIAAFFSYYLFAFSYDLPAAAGAPAVGTTAPEFALADQTGKTVQLSSLRGRKTLLVFYRGFW